MENSNFKIFLKKKYSVFVCVCGGGGRVDLWKNRWRVFYLIRTPLFMNVCYKVTQGTEKEVTFPWVDLRGSPQIEKEGKKK